MCSSAYLSIYTSSNYFELISFYKTLLCHLRILRQNYLLLKLQPFRGFKSAPSGDSAFIPPLIILSQPPSTKPPFAICVNLRQKHLPPFKHIFPPTHPPIFQLLSLRYV